MIDILELNHVTLIVADMDRAQHFYCAVLGLEPVTLPSTFTHATRWFRRGRAELHLVGQADAAQAPGDPPTHRAGERDHSRTRHLAFAVADVEAAVEALQAHSIPIVLGPRPRGDGATQLFCYDPDGHLVELHTLPPTPR